MSIRVGLISYPMLKQKQGGLQIQISETLKALQGCGVDARMVNTMEDDLADYDVLHVFSSNHGTHNIIHTAKEKGCKVVLSPLAEDKWNATFAKRSRLLEPVIKKLSGYLNYSFYSTIYDAIGRCDHLVALGEGEANALHSAFDVPKNKLSIIPNGIPARFFTASADYFVQETGITDKFVLNVGKIHKHKNQLFLAKLMKQTVPDLRLVLIGHVTPDNQGYLDEILSVGNTEYVGAFGYDSQMLASAYCAATVFVLPSVQEVMPLSALEAMAAGTPAMVTQVSSMRFPGSGNEFTLIDPQNATDVAAKLRTVLDALPSADSCQKLVKSLTWDEVAKKLNQIYQSL